MPRLVLEDGADVVTGKGSGVGRLVTQRVQQLAPAIEVAKARIRCADPERPRGILRDARDMTARERAQVRETMMLGLPALEPGLGPDPERPGPIEQQGVDVVVDDRARV